MNQAATNLNCVHALYCAWLLNGQETKVKYQAKPVCPVATIKMYNIVCVYAPTFLSLEILFCNLLPFENKF